VWRTKYKYYIQTKSDCSTGRRCGAGVRVTRQTATDYQVPSTLANQRGAARAAASLTE